MVNFKYLLNDWDRTEQKFPLKLNIKPYVMNEHVLHLMIKSVPTNNASRNLLDLKRLTGLPYKYYGDGT